MNVMSLQIRGPLRWHQDSGAGYIHGRLVAGAPAATPRDRTTTGSAQRHRGLHHQSRQTYDNFF